MKFVNVEKIKNAKYENYPFPHVIIDNFLLEDNLDITLESINNLKDEEAQAKYINPNSPYEFNKLAFNRNYGNCLHALFTELNSPEFISHLEKLTGIEDIVSGDIALEGAGIHRIKKGGYLKLHTDFNTYYNEKYGKLDRRINLLIYMNPEWKEEYNGALCLCDKYKEVCVKKVFPILNRCIIFNTSHMSIHGHPEVLNVPPDISRQSIAVYYYTPNENGIYDFEGCTEHSTIWYSNINVTSSGKIV